MAATSRERFRLALEHKNLDKTVVDLGSTPHYRTSMPIL